MFRRHLSTLLHYLSILAEQPTTHLGKHRKKGTDAKVHAQIQTELTFWRDVLVPKWQHAFTQLTADGRFAVLGVVLLAALAQVGRTVGLSAAYESIGEEEVRRVLNKFAQEAWENDDEDAEGGDEGTRIEREDVGEKLTRDPLSDDEGQPVEDAKAVEREIRRGGSSSCMAPEQDVLEQSRKVLVQASTPPALADDDSARSLVVPVEGKAKVKSKDELPKTKGEKRTARDKSLSSPKPPKKKKKKNAIDDLFSGL